jgi:hypothetical protein
MYALNINLLFNEWLSIEMIEMKTVTAMMMSVIMDAKIVI